MSLYNMVNGFNLACVMIFQATDEGENSDEGK